MLTYNVTLHRHGKTVFSGSVPARHVMVAGDYYGGHPYQPDPEAVIAALPYRYREAAKERFRLWKAHATDGRKVPLRCPLISAHGDELAMLYVTPDWPAL
jgi:hypothetical protein